MKAVSILALLFPIVSLATPGYYGTDVKIKSREGDNFFVEQAGHALKINGKKLPADIRSLWTSKVGKTIESAIPYEAVVEDKEIKGAKPLSVTGR